MGIFTAWGAVKQGASFHSGFPPVPFGPNQVGKRLFPTLCNFSVPAEQSKESAKSESVSVCLLNNSMATLMTRGALLLLSVLIASRTHQHLFFPTQLCCLEIAICCSPLLASPLKSSLTYSSLAFFGTKRFSFLSFISFLVVYSLSSPHCAMPFSNELFSPGPSSPLSHTSAVPHLVLLISGALSWLYHIL